MKQPQFYSLITDCIDTNAIARQKVRAQTLFPGLDPAITDVQDVVALAGNIIDILAVAEHAQSHGVIIGNRAPRNHIQNKYPNGAPFVYATHNDTLLVVTYSEPLATLLEKFLGITTWYEPNQSMLDDIYTTYGIDPTTQFRSLYYAPCLAHYLLEKGIPEGNIFTEEHNTEIPPFTIWHVDNFGNLKTFATCSDLEQGATPDLPFVERLKDVADGDLVLIEGSSGLPHKKFLECIVQGGRACDVLGKGVGDNLTI